MAFVFVHTADWQIGKTFGRFSPEAGAVLRQARIDAIGRIAGVAREAGARDVLVAGDVFDSETLKADVVASALGKMALQRDVTWHLTAGNHDPARAGGVWDTVEGAKPAANIRVHRDPQPVEIGAGVHLLPASLTAKASSHDPTAWMDAAATPAGAIRIGMAHGSIRGFGSLGEAAVQIDPERPRAANLAYLALGDWHGTLQINPRTWYSGTPEPDSFADNSPGNVLVVRIDNGAAAVTPVSTAAYRWIDRAADVSTGHALAALDAEIAALGPRASSLVVNLVLSGEVAISASDALDARIRLLRTMVFALRDDRTRLRFVADGSAIDELGDATLTTVAGRLAEQAKSAADSRDRDIASLALRRLIALSRARAGGSGS